MQQPCLQLPQRDRTGREAVADCGAVQGQGGWVAHQQPKRPVQHRKRPLGAIRATAFPSRRERAGGGAAHAGQGGQAQATPSERSRVGAAAGHGRPGSSPPPIQHRPARCQQASADDDRAVCWLDECWSSHRQEVRCTPTRRGSVADQQRRSTLAGDPRILPKPELSTIWSGEGAARLQWLPCSRRRCPVRSMVWPTSPGTMACAGVCRVPWTRRRVGCRPCCRRCLKDQAGQTTTWSVRPFPWRARKFRRHGT